VKAPPGHRGNAIRIAFWADTEDEVNRFGAIVREAGAQNVEGPECCREYTPGYYALFFEYADGNKWEICCRNARIREALTAFARGNEFLQDSRADPYSAHYTYSAYTAVLRTRGARGSW
jgi:hypothetical protein